MPTMSVLIGGAAGALITFLLTTCRWWFRRRRLAKEAAKSLVPHLEALDAAVTDALAAYSWEPVDQLDLTDHSLPRLTITIINGLPQQSAEPFTDGVVAVHELDRARTSMALAAPHERDRVESYRRRIGTASTIASTVADGARRTPQHSHS
jgi:hypothetical protein